MSVTSADQTGGATTFLNVNTSTGNSASPSVSVSSLSSRLCMGGFTSGGNFSSSTSGTDINHNNTGNLSSAAANQGAGSLTALTYTTTDALCGLRSSAVSRAHDRRRRHQPSRPPLAKIRPGRPAPAMGPGTATGVTEVVKEFPGSPVSVLIPTLRPKASAWSSASSKAKAAKTAT
jgi:hypothetical protein